MAWNKPTEVAETEHANRAQRKHPLKVTLYVGLPLTLIIVAIIAMIGRNSSHTKANGKALRKAHQVVAKVNPPHAELKTSQAAPLQQKLADLKIPVTNVITARAEVARIETRRDGTIVTNCFKAVFRRPLERSLHSALRPGGFAASQISALQHMYSETQILGMLKEITKPDPDDDEKVAVLKDRVQKMKEGILLEVANGRSVNDVLTELRRKCATERSIRVEAEKAVREAERTGDAKTVRNVLLKANEIREENGIAPIKASPIFRKEIARLEAEERDAVKAQQSQDIVELNNEIENSTK